MAVKLLAFCKSHILRIKKGSAKAFTKQKTHPNGTFSAGYGDAHLLPSTQEAEAGRRRVQGQPGLYTDALT